MSIVGLAMKRMARAWAPALLTLSAVIALGWAHVAAQQAEDQGAVTQRLEAQRQRLPAQATFTIRESNAFRLLVRAEQNFLKEVPKSAAALNVSPQAIQKRAFNVAIRKLANTRIPPNFLELEKARRTRVGAPEALALESGVSPTAHAFDWRTKQQVTPVRTYLDNTGQDACGCCWDFAAIAVVESSLIKAHRGNAATLDASEQDILNQMKQASGRDGCDGGWYQEAWTIMESTGTATEKAVPFKAIPEDPTPGVVRPYRVVNYGLVSDSASIPSPMEIKRALCQYGPLAVAVMADDNFVAYGGGVFTGFASENKPDAQINHAITLIGWDDRKGPHGAWLIKNSWGNDWGDTGGYGQEKGYMWIDYKSNNIGFAAAWARATSSAAGSP
jgi:C1A family cysteine protease